MGHGKAPFHSGKSKSYYCPFGKSCVFLNGEAPETILADRDYLRDRVDELEFAMDIGNHQALKLQERIKELEDDKAKLEKDLSEALQAPFKKYKRKETSSSKKRGAPVGHPGWFRRKPEQIDKTVDVYLDVCPLCGSENISPCNHTTEHIQEELEHCKLTSTCFVHWSSRHNIVPNFRFHLFSLFLYPFGCRVSQYLNHVRNFNTPHRTGLEDFPHPALRLNSRTR